VAAEGNQEQEIMPRHAPRKRRRTAQPRQAEPPDNPQKAGEHEPEHNKNIYEKLTLTRTKNELMTPVDSR
jgi:hypothetical protein